jgi:hypothetical protein
MRQCSCPIRPRNTSLQNKTRVVTCGTTPGSTGYTGKLGKCSTCVHGIHKRQTAAAHLVWWTVGVQVSQLWPCDGDHLASCVELHGAAAQGNHGVRQRQVAVLQALKVAQHLVLTAAAQQKVQR